MMRVQKPLAVRRDKRSGLVLPTWVPRPEAIREVQEEKKEIAARNLQAAVDCVEVGDAAREA